MDEADQTLLKPAARELADGHPALVPMNAFLLLVAAAALFGIWVS